MEEIFKKADFSARRMSVDGKHLTNVWFDNDIAPFNEKTKQMENI